MAKQKTPHYSDPPVVEAVLGAQFKDLKLLKSAHVGGIWEALGTETYPNIEDKPPLPKLNESPTFIVSQSTRLPRTWFKNTDGNSLLQFQSDRFCYNWRSFTEESPYNKKQFPRFIDRLKFFKNAYKLLENKIHEMTELSISLELLEMSYINLIPFSHIKDFSQIGTIFPDFCWNSQSRYLSPPNSISFSWNFDMPEIKAEHTISVANAINNKTGEGVLKLHNITITVQIYFCWVLINRRKSI